MTLERFFEILPGGLMWLTFILMPLFSWLFPFQTAIFIIFYDFFWLLRIIYLYFHLRVSFNKMRANLKINWLKKLENELDGKWQNIFHLIVLPMYKEPYEVIEETFKALSAVNYPKNRIIIVLATEERGGDEARQTARRVKDNYAAGFFDFIITEHPFGLPGEIPGKGSNETWAVKEAKTKIIDSRAIPYEQVVVSVFDIDTQAPPEYFGRLAYVFLTCENPQRSSFQPIPLFINNVFSATAFSRVMAFFPTFWQMMQQSRFEQLSTFSSQAMPFKALVEVDYWDTDRVSEDSLIFFRFYTHYDGDWRTEPLYYPVHMDVNAAANIWQTAVNLYKQQRRWAWGTENIPYMVARFRKNRKIPFKEKLSWTLLFMEGFYSWATASFILFAFGWLPGLLGGAAFNQTLIAYNMPKITFYLMNFSTFGIALSAILSAALLPPRPIWFRWYHYLIYALEWILTPLILIVFSAVPAVEAQTRLMLGGRFRLGFWATPKSR